ncbi:MAG: NUDIX hydrolase [Planctomycetota bacterium]
MSEQAHRPALNIRRGVIGILNRGDEYLMIRRAPGVPKGGAWCFPGGHVEPGETPRKAVVRELAEELGIRVVPTIRIGAVRVPDTGHVLAVWCVRQLSGVFRLAEKEISEVRWLPLSQIGTMNPGLPSNELVVKLLIG